MANIRYELKIEEIRGAIATLLEDIVESNRISFVAFESSNSEGFILVESRLNNIQTKIDIVDNEIIKTFALFGPEANELRTLVAFLKMTNEIGRIGEGVKKYAKRMSDHMKSDCDFAPLKSTIQKLHKSSLDAIRYILECFQNLKECEAEEYFRKIMVEESISDDLFGILEKEIMTLILTQKELSVEYVKILATLRKLERSCDRSVNIASLMLFAKNGGEIHSHL